MFFVVLVSLVAFTFFHDFLHHIPPLMKFVHGVAEIFGQVWWSLILSVFVVAVLGRIPKAYITSLLGTRRGMRGILRATLLGLLFDLCSHGILLVGAKLYERGASLGQMVAFLLASPWNSFSFTLILFSLVGLKWTLAMILLSGIVAVVSGVLLDRWVKKGILPENPHSADSGDQELPPMFRSAYEYLKKKPFSLSGTGSLLREGLRESRMIMRWIFFGIVLTAFIRAAVPVELFEQFAGPTLAGLGMTLAVATVLEICSEGSTPIAADLLTRAHAPGNAFAFLMAGVATDYTEILVVRQATRSWKIAFFIPLVTVPQVVLIGWVLNTYF